MSIKQPFGGSIIRKPGAYSISQVDQSTGSPLTSAGTLFLLGEASAGAPGSSEGIQSFSAAQLSQLIAKYQSGPIVDMAKAACDPSLTPGINGPDQLLVWKTNASTQASLSLLNGSAAAVIVLKDSAWGANGNGTLVTIGSGTTGNQKTVTLQNGTYIESLGQNAAIAQLSIQYTGTGSAASLSITGATPALKVLATVCTGATGDNLSIPLAGLSIPQLIAAISASGKYTVVQLGDNTVSITSSTDLDDVAAADIKTSPVSLYKLHVELINLVNQNSKICVASRPATLAAGVPANVAAYLSGGALGASANSDFSTGLSKSLSFNYDLALPGVSQDATADIALGVTSSSSAYTIASVQAALGSHLLLRSQTKIRKEAQGMVGFRNSAKAACNTQAQSLNNYLLQMMIQDVLVVDAVSGSLAWKQPHVMAALCAGIRLGTSVGTPITFKFLNCSGLGHDVNPATGISAGDFDPTQDFDPAIDAGVTFAEPASGSFRIVVDNTTYGIDQSFVFNRGSVVEASINIAKNVRTTAESVFVGNKVVAGTAALIKSQIAAVLDNLFNSQVLGSSPSAPRGYNAKTFSVSIVGNTATIQLEVIPVQGLDFILIQFSLGNTIEQA